MTVIVLTSGEYSDYRIRGVFSTKELAEKYVETITASDPNYREWDYEEWELDDENLPIYQTQWTVFIAMSDGRITDEMERKIMAYRDESRAFIGGAAHDRHVVGQSVVSREHALKVAAELRQADLRKEKA